MSEFKVGSTVRLSQEAINSGSFRDYPGEGLKVSEVLPSEEGQDVRVKLTHPDWQLWVSQAISTYWLRLV